jgi:hypothetical protein
MRMRLEAELGLGAHTLNHPGEASGGGWRAPHQEFGLRIGSPIFKARSPLTHLTEKKK